ncbi:2-keto-4-pentenoate hydratase [Herbaspirillum sp. SJZ107]|uniref:2-keto-4-pentenoate hydratase n=1 Tax=Herbaspirillum sp. SJZ107 TaxID=2572881 RepID=UPI00115074E1|nr:fumarylacetoacetate hydrolase family protein [Herbaspirillum sp. SJZ107]TQK05593.1 2-keto-4-pentenoate hydratase [Herbaspirillum sp. SJZ107]
MTSTPEELGILLSDAHAQKAGQVTVPAHLEPASGADAYRAQQAFLQRRGLDIGGWKIGAKSEDGPIQGAPLPRQGIYASGAAVARSDFPVFGIELEIMFRFGRDFLPGSAAVTEEQVLSAIDGIAASIEIVSSRLTGWPDVPKLNQLADLQNHGALIAGEFVAYDAGVDFRSPQAHLVLNGRDVFKGAGTNPAGDPRRLLHWLVGHCNAQNIALPAGTVITAGSYTGMLFPEEAGLVVGEIAGLPPVRFDIA